MCAQTRGATRFYQVTLRSAGSRPIFSDNCDRSVFVGLIKRYFSDHGIEMAAWCLLADSVHLLLCANKTRLAEALREVTTIYVGYYTRRTGRKGALFQRRFPTEPVTTEGQLREAVRNIHLKPYNCGISRGVPYRWSSYETYLSARPPQAVGWALGVFGGRKSFLVYHHIESAGASLDTPALLRSDRGADDYDRRMISATSSATLAA